MTQIRSTLAEIAPRLKAHLVDRLEIDPSRVIWRGAKKGLSAWPIIPQWFVSLVIGDPNPDGESQIAAGRYNLLVVRPLEVKIHSQLALDQPDRDEYALLHPEDGLWVRQHQVLNALFNFSPKDDAGRLLTAGPLFLLPANSMPDTGDPPPDRHSTRFVLGLRYIEAFDPLTCP